jgi:hypothetical protein
VTEGIKYYAVVPEHRTIGNPSGLARRRFFEGEPVDESLRRDFSWGFTDAIYQAERGENLGPELVEVSEEEANRIIERFRAKWVGQG